ncbi:putative aldouronate transport system substrate-binding protein [Hamadaea flava]|uniref:Extracellular solute-binding protein n=1 Tax=Hamadaea flava TaxID=1742688 RepID=A0ABV8LQ00_9ACTN|nr:extracellular solute-binding protein [Hamadaea flava]MCP2322976.1 putative aldouronate transport system substrate-binding protein [Hamadaea flava]
MYQLSRRQVLLAAGAAASTLALAGCGDDDEGDQDLSGKKAGAMDKYAAGDQFKATEAVKFSIMLLSNAGYPYKADWLFWSELTKRTNVTLEPTVIPGSDYNQKRSVMVSAGDAPMIIPKTYHPDEEALIAGGAILPVSDYLDLMPNFKDKVAKWKLDSDLDTYRQEDGKFYLLPGIHETVYVDYSLAVRTDILAKLNLQVPKTWDDLHAVLKAMKTAYPDQYPMSDRWSTPPQPGGNNLLALLSNAYGTGAGWDYQNAWFDKSAGKFVLTGAMDQYKQMLTFANTLVSEKLLDPESFTQQDDQARQKFANGKSFVISCNAQTLVNELRKDIAKIPGATVVKIPRPIGPNGANRPGTARLESGIMISKKALESKNFVAMMQFIDWLWYSDAGQEFAKWGVEGTTFTKDAAGKRTLTPDVNVVGLNPSGSKHLQVDFGFYNGVFAYGGSTELRESFYSDEEKEFQKEMNSREALPVPPPKPFSVDERERATLWETGIKDYVFQQTLKFILNQRPLGDWDKYVAELKGKNADQYVELVNKAYDRYKKAHP